MRRFWEAFRVKQHINVHIKENDQHDDDAASRNPSSGRNQEAQTAGQLGNPAQRHQGCRMGVVVRHDVEVEGRVGEVIDPAQHIHPRLRPKANPKLSHAQLDASPQPEWRRCLFQLKIRGGARTTRGYAGTTTTTQPRGVMNPKRVVSAVFLALSLHAAPGLHAQQPGSLADQYKPAADRLIAAAMADKEGYARLAYLTDHIGKRLSGSEPLTRATTWAAQAMRDAGLQNVTMQPVMVPHWVRGAESAAITAPVSKPLHMLGLGMSVGTRPGGLTAEVVVVPDFASLEKLGRAGVQGKIVVFNAPYKSYGQTVMYRTAGPSRAAALGAVAVLVRSITPLAMQTPHTGTMVYDPKQPKVPAAAISIEDALLLDRLAREGATTVHLEMAAQQLPDAPSFNIYGDIPGSEHPEQVVDVGGHIDSWDVGQGAQDDGSGITAALAAVALIKKLDLHPKRTIRVVFWVNEENGGAGGKAYLAGLGDKVKDHVAAIEMDGGAEQPVGYGYGSGGLHRRATPDAPAPKPDLSAAEHHSLTQLNEIAALLSPVGATTVKAGGGGSDIGPLMGAGVPGLGEMTTVAHYFDWHHTEADTLDKVDPEDFRKNVASLAVMTYVLADMPDRLAGHPGASEE